jgi:hypothetical protein
MNLKEASDLIVSMFKTQVSTGQRFAIELESGPGLGKSSTIHQIRRRLEREFAEPVALTEFFLSTCEAPDVIGFRMPDKNADGEMVTMTARPEWMPGKTSPKFGIVFLDEFRQAAHDVQKPAAELLLNGKVGPWQLPITWMVISASNREKDRSGVQRSLAFIENRRVLIKVEPSVDAWVEWAEREGSVHPLAIAFAKFKPGVVFAEQIPDKVGPFCTPRTLVKTSYLIDKLPMEAFTAVAQGYMGEGAGAELVAFLRVAEQLPTFEEIIANPTKTAIPDRPDALYAAMQMVAHRVSEETAAPAFKYLKRMAKEYQVAGLKAVLRRAPTIATDKDFGQWLRDNKDLVLAANLAGKK